MPTCASSGPDKRALVARRSTRAVAAQGAAHEDRRGRVARPGSGDVSRAHRGAGSTASPSWTASTRAADRAPRVGAAEALRARLIVATRQHARRQIAAPDVVVDFVYRRLRGSTSTSPPITLRTRSANLASATARRCCRSPCPMRPSPSTLVAEGRVIDGSAASCASTSTSPPIRAPSRAPDGPRRPHPHPPGLVPSSSRSHLPETAPDTSERDGRLARCA